MTSPLLTLPAAVPADPPDAGVAAHYGDPHGEQRRLAEERRGFVDLSHRGVLRVAGPDRLTWLHSFTSQHLERLKPGVAVEALILSPQGRVEHALYLVDDGEAAWFHVEPGTAPEVLAFLEKMRFMMRVEPEDVTDRYALVLTAGPVPEGVLAREVDLGHELFLPSGAPGGVRRGRRRGRPGGMWAHEALRIAAHRPRVGLETDERTIPHEIDWIATDGHPGAVHLNKGCYRGRRRSPGSTTSATRRAGWSSCTWTAPRSGCRRTATDVDNRRRPRGRPGDLGGAALRAGTGGAGVVKRRRRSRTQLLADGIPATQEVVVPPDAGANRRPAFRAAR